MRNLADGLTASHDQRAVRGEARLADREAEAIEEGRPKSVSSQRI